MIKFGGSEFEETSADKPGKILKDLTLLLELCAILAIVVGLAVMFM